MKKIILLFGGLFFFIFILFYIVSQPLFPSFGEKKLGDQESAKRLKEHVEYLSKNLIPRNFVYPENLNKVANYIEGIFKENQARVEVQTYELDYKNIIASYGPPSEKRIVIGAHYDAYREFPGADDNASGVAVLLELSRAFKNKAPPIQVDLVAYTLEEPPFFRTDMMGSFIHAQSLKEKNVQLKLMISLETLGYFSDEKDSQEYPASFLKWVYGSRGDFICIVGEMSDWFLVRDIKKTFHSHYSLPVQSMNVSSIVPGIDFSDHLNYWKFAYPAVMISDTAFYRNKNYHSAEDTAEKLDYLKMSQVLGGVWQYVMENKN